MKPLHLSVILPTHKEDGQSYLLKIASHYPFHPSLEYLVLDTDTPPSILSRIQRDDFHTHSLPKGTTRAKKINEGVQKAQGSMILCHHPRSLVDPKGLLFLLENSQQLQWGAFTHQFDEHSPGLRFTSWYSNHVRPNWSKVYYLDHGIFFRKELLTRKIPDMPIFEDTELCRILRKSAPPRRLPFVSETSAVRFRTNGFWRQSLMNQKLKWDYHRGRSSVSMNNQYEKDLHLNG